ncbi:MAG TPA: hypothetical protein PLU72_11020 [Candidatus Ozemobacteraceae bacterium]|nr:hypothetical protein [Candidatus Ozemobacteraceae bacterium]
MNNNWELICFSENPMYRVPRNRWLKLNRCRRCRMLPSSKDSMGTAENPAFQEAIGACSGWNAAITTPFRSAT